MNKKPNNFPKGYPWKKRYEIKNVHEEESQRGLKRKQNGKWGKEINLANVKNESNCIKSVEKFGLIFNRWFYVHAMQATADNNHVLVKIIPSNVRAWNWFIYFTWMCAVFIYLFSEWELKYICVLYYVM